ncbi:Bpu10I family restriction endonuclease [Butyrivibrio sp. AD3002]|uniref:Bpu10I family restriction endonuclease n=1 Tax=Butyrivibrio sp. AD3002 TaxID=1280670 RepID=UPI0003B320F9|nr:Bpu10I family restriction endonuclease [Butyrivibrio sp. AD3002]
MKTYDELIDELNIINETTKMDLSALPHCSNLLYQLQKRDDKNHKFLDSVIKKYIDIRKITFSNIDDYVNKIVACVNDYMDMFWPQKNNPYVHQSDFASSVVPEMLCLIFYEIIKANKSDMEVSAQKNLTIECIFDFTDGGSVRFKSKRVDVAVVKNCLLKLDDKEYELPIPLLAIECKTNLDKNMLSGIEFSVGELKKTFPECNYLVVTELSDFAVKKLNYASSGINEMYVLRQQKRAEVRRAPYPRNSINTDLVKEISYLFEKSLNDISIESGQLNKKMQEGKLIGRN